MKTRASFQIFQEITGYTWWVNFIAKTINADPITGNPYGGWSDYIEVGESWAEFLGTNFAMRRYPGTTGIKDASNRIGSIIPGRYYRMDNLIENEFWFFSGQSIPYGLYHDLMDNTNVLPNNPLEDWDVIQGVTIRQMYNAQGSNVKNMCEYWPSFINQNPLLNQADLDKIFIRHNAICR